MTIEPYDYGNFKNKRNKKKPKTHDLKITLSDELFNKILFSANRKGFGLHELNHFVNMTLRKKFLGK